MDINAIETYYNGYKFRSRLEARWAVFFDALGVEYEYEPEGYHLPNGEKYLPDFRIKCYGKRGCCDYNEPFDLYVEVKGKMTQRDADKIKAFAGWVKDAGYANPVLIVGNIPSQYGASDSSVMHSYEPMNGINIYPCNYELIDGDHFGAYPAAIDGKFYLWGDEGSQIHDTEIVEKAYDKARQARFEHGEKP